MYQFDFDALKEQLKHLPHSHRVAFAVSCCERLLPTYKRFSETEHLGDFDHLRDAVNTIWNYLSGHEVSEETLRAFIVTCNEATPDSEDFTSPLTSAAIDAGGAVYETLHCCLDGSPERAAQVASFARDTVDMYIQERDDMDYSDPEFEAKILRDPLMVNELQRQAEELEMIKNQSVLDQDFLNTLRSMNEGKSNIG